MINPRPEILAPAGTPDKMKTALHFGADAVYLGLRQFSMRSFAGNFTYDKLEWALAYAHERGRKVYVAVNIQPFDADLDAIEGALKTLADLNPDGLIVADPGVIDLARRSCPDLPLHLSTQSSVINSGAARFWFAQGFRRIIAARELSVEQLAVIVRETGGNIEAFVHGAVCIAYSGRCLLSLYWANRDPRRGACAQGCRWQYKELEDKRRPGQGNPVEQDERGTYFFDAKDLCGLPLLESILAAGIRSLKIEGRTRSEYYVGTTVDVYLHAANLLAEGNVAEFDRRQAGYMAELSLGSNRGFSTHFLEGSERGPGPEAYNPEGSYRNRRNDFLGRVVARTDEYVDVALRNPVMPGDPIELRDRGLVCQEATATPLTTTDGEILSRAQTGHTIRLPGRFTVQPGALARVPAPNPIDVKDVGKDNA
jgi:U32 family peptidase